MPFALYMIGFLLVMAALVWGAVVIGLPQHYIALGVLALAAVAAALAVARRRGRRAEERRR